MDIQTTVELLLCVVFLMTSTQGCSQRDEININVTLIKNAKAKGAVCLDGSSGAYYFSMGSGDGINNWMVYLEGGAWCFNDAQCFIRSKTSLGSTNFSSYYTCEGILSPNPNINPDFFNWNKVAIHYCDGASFLADVETTAHFNGTNLYRRGRRIFTSVIEELLQHKGMKHANNVVLAGSSSGGMATILHCDFFRSFFHKVDRLKCISDAGFFIHAKDLYEAARFRGNSRALLANFHDLDRMLPKSCTSRNNASLCLFPEYVIDDIKTPLFILNSDFDNNQLAYSFNPYHPSDEPGWKTCANHIQRCTANQLRVVEDFRTAFLKTIEGLQDNASRGYFITSCHSHFLALNNKNWQGIPTLKNKTIAQAIGDWYFDKSNVKLIDTKNIYPLNCKA